VDDAIDAFLLAATNEQTYGKYFNLGGEPPVNLKELADLLVLINGSGEYRICNFMEDRKKIDIGDYYSDFTLIREVLGWKPRISLQEGLKHTLAFYRENLKHYL